MIPFKWTQHHVAGIAATAAATPLIARAIIKIPVADLDIWDHWPVLEEDGQIATIAGGTLVVALSAPVGGQPDDRHALSRLRLFHTIDGTWHDLGHVLPDGFSPGSREWAGSAIVDAAHTRLTLHFTAAGVRDETATSFGQRLFTAAATLDTATSRPRLTNWTCPVETIAPDGIDYQANLSGGMEIGTIKAFRDPYLWRDPKDGADYLLFAGSRAGATSPWNGVIGIARRDGDGWTLLPPLVDATGLNNELERPHLVVFGGRRYLFWSTQAKVFARGGPQGPTGLYGVVADDIGGPWRPINGSCLVFRNPDSAPFQAYSWQVLADGSVWSFADLVGLGHPPRDGIEARRHFGGAPAPVLHLDIDGETVRLK